MRAGPRNTAVGTMARSRHARGKTAGSGRGGRARGRRNVTWALACSLRVRSPGRLISMEEPMMEGRFQASARHPARAAAGFTLVELAIVLVIFGIVSAIAVPGLNKFLRALEL